MQINDDNKNLNSQEIADSLDKNKYQVIIGGEGVCIRNGEKYTIDEEKYIEGVNLSNKFIDSFFDGYSGIGCTSEEFHKMLIESGYSDKIIELILECMCCMAPIDLTVIHTVHNCRPTHNKLEISDEEKDNIIIGYIINVLKAYYEEIKNRAKNHPEKVDEDTSNLDTKVSLESLEKYKDAQKIDNIEIIYDVRGLSNSNLPFSVRKNLERRVEVAASHGTGRIYKKSLKDEIAQFAKEQRIGAIERTRNLFASIIKQDRDGEEPRR